MAIEVRGPLHILLMYPLGSIVAVAMTRTAVYATTPALILPAYKSAKAGKGGTNMRRLWLGSLIGAVCTPIVALLSLSILDPTPLLIACVTATLVAGGLDESIGVGIVIGASFPVAPLLLKRGNVEG